MLSQKQAEKMSIKADIREENLLVALISRIVFFFERTIMDCRIRFAAYKGKRFIYVEKGSISQKLIDFLKEKGYEVYGDEYEFIYTFCGWIQPIYIEW